MLTPVAGSRFRRDVKLAEKRGKAMQKLRVVLDLLIEEKPLPAHYKGHPLTGDWASYRDLHIEPDWLLIYRSTQTELFLVRTGTHADLF